MLVRRLVGGGRACGRHGRRIAALVAELKTRIILAGALFAGSGVALGAFGAHALRDLFGPQQTGWWQTAVQYQMWHAIVLFAIGLAGPPRSGVPALLLGIGILLFSGSLYLMAITDLRWLGVVTPFGGTAFIAAWVMLAWQAFRR